MRFRFNNIRARSMQILAEIAALACIIWHCQSAIVGSSLSVASPALVSACPQIVGWTDVNMINYNFSGSISTQNFSMVEKFKLYTTTASNRTYSFACHLSAPVNQTGSIGQNSDFNVFSFNASTRTYTSLGWKYKLSNLLNYAFSDYD